MKPYLEECRRVNKSFQSNSADQSQLLNDLVVLISGITKIIVVPGFRGNLMTVDVRKHRSPKIYLGHEVEILLSELAKKKEINHESENVFRDRCENFLICLVTELQRRLPRNIEVLQKVSLISVKQCLRVVKEPIIMLAKEMGLSDSDVTKIDLQ